MISQLRELERHLSLHRGDGADEPDGGVAHRTRDPASQRGGPRNPVGERHHLLRDWSPTVFVLIEQILRVLFRNQVIGTFYGDLVVEGVVLVEVKAAAAIGFQRLPRL